MAYQGKFSQPRNTEENIRLKKEAAKKAAAEARAESQEAAAPPETAAAPAAKPAAPAPKRAATEVKQAPKQVSDVKSAPAKKNTRKKKKNKGNRTITLIFYTCYFALVAALLGGIFFLNSWIKDWLVDYEASQPTTRCEEVFQEYFADPDWAALYAMAGLTDTEYEDNSAFVQFMDAKVGSRELTYVETSAGLSGGHKYLLKLDFFPRMIL